MRTFKLADVWLQVKLSKGIAKNMVKTQEVIDDADDPDAIVATLESGKLKFKVKKKTKNSETVIE